MVYCIVNKKSVKTNRKWSPRRTKEQIKKEKKVFQRKDCAGIIQENGVKNIKRSKDKENLKDTYYSENQEGHF